MTYARSSLVDAENPGFYHLVSRCVRRAWLCGFDKTTSRSFEHRREWIEKRIMFLSQIFAVEVFSYSVMSNHYHIVIRLDPKAPQDWSDETVASRWIALRPSKEAIQTQNRIKSLLLDEARLSECRIRLGSLSWYMRYINERMARLANREDGCTGRFWEGRFGSIALLDEPAVMSGMVYVDLNPVRAGINIFTSVRKRVSAGGRQSTLKAVASGLTQNGCEIAIGEPQYLKLVQATARYVHPDSTQELECPETNGWLSAVGAHARKDRRAFGSLAKLYDLAHRLGQQWVRGCGQTCRFRNVPPLSRTMELASFF